MADTLSQLGEFGFIDLIKKQAKTSRPVIKGIGDDTAVLPLSAKKYLLLTTDMLVEGVHFTLKMPSKTIGHKAIASSISDIAAMGGMPKYAVVSLGAPPTASRQMISQIYQGICKTAKKFHVGIVGGDTVKSQKIIINVALLGEAKKSDVVYRNGARAGDQIFVTGSLGGSLSSGWHLRFVPRVAEARYLAEKYKPTAMIDISDGLAADLGHILKESRVGAVIEESSVPKRGKARLKDALYDGEDFELLFTLPPLKAQKLEGRNKGKYRFDRIGEIVPKSKGLRLKTSAGRLKKLNIKGYTHF
jgi:thiamine-monophosphate kinase